MIKYLKEGGHVIVFPNKENNNISILLDSQTIDLKYENSNHIVTKDDIIDLTLNKEIFSESNQNTLFNIKRG